MNRVVISNAKSIYENLAIEEALFNELRQEECILFLWQPDKTLVLGNNQSAYLECNIPYCEENGIDIARRLSGGGCVYQDLGNLNYSFLYYTNSKHKEVKEQEFVDIILMVLNYYSLKQLEQKNNDILANGKKVSGIAYYEEDGKRILHGTLLVDVNMEHLSRSLQVNAKKLKFNGVESVRARVENLHELDQTISVERLKNDIKEMFLRKFETSQVNYIEAVQNKEDLEKYKETSWIFEESPECSLILEEKTRNGLFQLVYRLEQGKIRNPKLYSDTDFSYDFNNFLKAIEDTSYNEFNLKSRLKKELEKLDFFFRL